MAVIKRQHAAPLLKEAIVLDLGDVGRQAARIIAVAQDKARKVIENAQAHADKLVEGAAERGHKQGYEEGLAKGLEDGMAQGRKQGHDEAHAQASARLAQLQKTWSAALMRWEEKQNDFARDSRDAALALSLKLTEKIVHRVIEVNPEAVVDQVGAALAHVMESAQVVIHISAKDRDLVDESLPALLAEFSHLTSAKIVDDPKISPGGCIVNCGRGSIDGTLETQLARVVDLIFPQNQNKSQATLESLPESTPEVARGAATEAASDDSLAAAVDAALAEHDLSAQAELETETGLNQKDNDTNTDEDQPPNDSTDSTDPTGRGE